MSKLLPITKIVYENTDNVRCDHCSVWINDTERFHQYGYIFWCSECVKKDFEVLYEVLKSIDNKFQFLPQTYYDASQSYFLDGTFHLKQEQKKYRYYWWMNGEYINKIKAIPKTTPCKIDTCVGLMVRQTQDSKNYCWHGPKESAELIKPDRIIVLNKPYTFDVRWSDGTKDTYENGIRQ